MMSSSVHNRARQAAYRVAQTNTAVRDATPRWRYGHPRWKVEMFRAGMAERSQAGSR